MITLKTEDLREFFKRARNIKPHIILNVMNYIVLDTDEGTLTKSNMNTWCVHQINVESKENVKMFIDEKVLTPYLAAQIGEKITFKICEKKVKNAQGDMKPVRWVEYTDGKKNGQYGIPIDEYPKFPESGARSNSVKLGKEVVESVALASNLTLEDGTYFALVHIQNLKEYVAINASDRNCLYHKKIYQTDIPDIKVGPEACVILPMFAEWEYYSIGNYDVFDNGVTKYSFIQSVLPSPPFERLVEGFNDKNIFTIAKDDVHAFCDLAIKQSPSTLVESSFVGKGTKLKFLAENDDYNISTDEEFDITTNFKIVEWAFNAKNMMSLLKTIPYQKLSFASVDETKYYVFSEEDKNYLGMIQGFVAPPPVPGTQPAPKE